VFIIKHNDTRTALKAILKDATGAVVNLTGCQVVFIMTYQGKVLINRQALIMNETGGEVWVVFTKQETAQVGSMNGEFKVTFPDTSIETFPNGGYIQMQILPDLG
jgi:hypothetical protein